MDPLDLNSLVTAEDAAARLKKIEAINLAWADGRRLTVEKRKPDEAGLLEGTDAERGSVDDESRLCALLRHGLEGVEYDAWMQATPWQKARVLGRCADLLELSLNQKRALFINNGAADVTGS
jgi:hypothetical protein